MSLSLVFPMFWGRYKKKVYEEEDQFYDHPTALDDEGTIPPLFESLEILEDRDFDVIAVAGSNTPTLAEETEKTAYALLSKYAKKAGVRLHYFSYSHLEKLHAYLKDTGQPELCEAASLVGYSPLRNACFIAAHILGKDIAVSIDDDCVMIQPDYVARAKKNLLSDFEGRKILAYCGPYITPEGGIYLKRSTSPHAAYWNTTDTMNEMFRRHIVESPGVKEVPFAIMGNIAVHRDFYTQVPLDPPLRRGEDMDWVLNSHIFGHRFIMDTDWTIKHAPAPRPYPVWRPMREDIYRFRYQQAKVANSRDGDGYHNVDPERYMPFPGTYWRDDFADRAAMACTILASDYLAKGESENAREALQNILHAKVLAVPDTNPFEVYLAFQKKWTALMSTIENNRDEIRKRVFG